MSFDETDNASDNNFWDGTGQNDGSDVPETQAPQPESQVGSEEIPQTPAYSQSDYEAVQQRAELAERRFNDAQRALQGNTQQQQPQSSPEEWVGTIMDPNKLSEYNAQQYQVMREQERAHEAFLSKCRQDYPDMVPFEPYVIGDARKIWNEHAQRGETIPDDQAVKLAVDGFRQKLSGKVNDAIGRKTGQEVARLNPGAAKPQASKKPDFTNCTPQELRAWEQQNIKESYLT